jgi:hypothetical protein
VVGLARIALIGMALSFLVGGQAFAEARTADGSQPMIQLASASGGTNQVSGGAGSGGPLYPANNGIGKYICTPSGFGQLSTCHVRGGS